MAKKRLIIIDSNSVIHRAYHALPPLTTKDGQIVGAVYGFLLVFFKIIKEFQPQCIAAAFDLPAPTFRHAKFDGYKAKRQKTPEDLSDQIKRVKDVMRLFNVAVFEKEGFEADDLIGTITSRVLKEEPDVESIIVSGDLDNLQLVDQKTRVFFLRKGVKDIVLYDEHLVKERLGLGPEQLTDYKALRGDASDNIPGVPGIGEKTGVELIMKFNNLENLYQELEKDSLLAKEISPRYRQLLLDNKDQAFLSRELVQIDKAVPFDYDLTMCRWGEYNKEKIIEVFENLQFKSLIDRLPELEGKTVNEKKAKVEPIRRASKKTADGQKRLFN